MEMLFLCLCTWRDRVSSFELLSAWRSWEVLRLYESCCYLRGVGNFCRLAEVPLLIWRASVLQKGLFSSCSARGSMLPWTYTTP